MMQSRTLPTSFAQQRLWFLDQLVPGNPFYNEHVSVRLPFAVDVAAFERTIAEIVRRHDTLRTTFMAIDGEPMQVIAPSGTVSLGLIDLRHLPRDQREPHAARLAAEDARQPFDLARDALLRTTLVRVDDSEYVFLLTMHHIISDGWSLNVFGRELDALYPAVVMGKPSPLPPLSIQYGDFAVWQRQWLRGEVLDEQLAYWKRQLADLPVLQLPTDRPRPAVPSFRGAVHALDIPADLTAKLRAFGPQERATPFMVLLAAFQAVLSRYTGQDDIVIGAPIANRTRVELEPLIGFFVNTLVLRTSLAGDPTVRELVQRVRRVALEAYAHQDLPFEKLVEELQPRRDLSRNPLCQVMFQFFSTSASTNAGGNASAAHANGGAPPPFANNRDTAKFDLTVHVFEEAAGLSARFEYGRDLFDAATVARLARHFRQTLEAMVEHPDRRVSELPLLTASERRQILVDWNATERDYPRDRCFHELFEAQVDRTPTAIALTFGGATLTYAELDRRANRLAACLRELGVGPEVLVGISIERSFEMVIAVLGVLKAGGAYVPLDSAYPAERLAFMLADARAPVLLTQASVRDRLPAGAAHAICLDTDWPSVAAYPDHRVPSGATSSNLAYVIYTSGSTGTPKGVMIEHRGLANSTVEEARVFQNTADARVLQFSSFSFDGWIYEFMMAVGAGARLCLATREALLPGPDLVRVLRDEAITTVLFPPSALAALPHADLPHLQCLNVAGEACPPHVVTRWAPGRRFFNVYGPTEATCWCTTAEYNGPVDAVHIGRPMANAEIYILDSHLNPVPIGVVGELHIGGAGLARGYLHQPELTRQKFIPHPFRDDPGARLYKTGDLARYLPDGAIEFLGRRDHQVKLRGFRIELGEIESVLGRVEHVREVVVACHEDPDKRLVAYVVPELGHALHPSTLRAALRERLPEYMVPAAFLFLDALPVNANGKVDRAALPSPNGRAASTAAAAHAPGSNGGGRAQPDTDLGRAIAAVWREILDVDAAQIGVDDNFFDLGGHSLLIAKVHSRLRAVLPKEISMIDLFRYPTIGSLTRHVGEEAARPDDFLKAINDRVAKQRARARGAAGFGQEGGAAR